MHCAHGNQNSCERSDSDSDQSDPASPARTVLACRSKARDTSAGVGGCQACDVQGGPHGVGVAAEGGESPIKFVAHPDWRPVHNASDLCVRDALEVTEHQHGTLEFRQLVVRGDDSTKLFGHPFHTVSDSRIWRLPSLQEGLHGELTQVGRRVDQRRPALARGKEHGSSQVGWISAERRAPAEQVRQLVGVHPSRLAAACHVSARYNALGF